jgi:radical SAM superfamily enzyme YgiQ (UPF0313 family)
LATDYAAAGPAAGSENDGMKVLLISGNTTYTPHPVYPLGLDCVAGALAPRHAVRILDVNIEGAREQLAETLGGDPPDVVGLSIRNIDNVDVLAPRSYVPAYRQVARFIRERSRAPLVLGGCGFSIFPKELMDLLDADYGVVGEGEKMAALLEALEKGGTPSGLPGIVCRGGEVAEPGLWPGPVRRQTGPADARLGFYLEHGGILNLQTKRGCPFRCCYCVYPHLEGGHFRFFAPDEVAREAKALEELGARYLFITDSAFNADADHSLAVARALRSQGLGIPWGAFLAPLRPADGYYKALAEAGMAHAEFGTEALCDAQLARYGKPFSVEDVFAAHEAARSAGLHVAHYFLLGGPGETGQTLEETLTRMEALESAVLFVFCGIRILPHTPLQRLAMEEGQIAPGQDLLDPVFYRPAGIAREAIEECVRQQAGGRRNWIWGDGGPQIERVLARMFRRGQSGPLWELLLR